MKAKQPRRTATWGALGCLCLCSIAAGAQSSGNSKGSANSNPLENDPRLNVRVTVARKRITVADALRELRVRTSVKLEAEGNEVVPAFLALGYQSVPLKDILDSIAATHDWMWKRRKDGVLVLQERNRSRILDFLRPHTEAQAEVYQKGREFLDQLSKQPPEFQQAIMKQPPESNGIPFNSLPPNLQNTVRGMLDAHLQFADEINLPIRFAKESVPSSVIRFDVHNPQEGFTAYDVTLFDGTTSQSMSFCIFTDSDEGYQIVPTSQLPKSTIWYGAQEDAASRREAVASDPRLKQKVTMEIQRADIGEVLRLLAQAANIDFAAQHPGLNATRHSFACKQMPLKDVLDRIAALFHYTWGRRKSGVFMFHIAPPDRTAARPEARQK
ncbi:MAG TPA: hypothetical protein VFB21_11205 [Chthonomonadaceae bacterium]|nr:hypothetical protein [Chthonomonadaceae bacterium]